MDTKHTNSVEPNGTVGYSKGSQDDALIVALEALRPSERQIKETRFRKLYPWIRDARARGVLLKDVRAVLKKQGVDLSMPTFNRMMKECAESMPGGAVCEYCGSHTGRTMNAHEAGVSESAAQSEVLRHAENETAWRGEAEPRLQYERPGIESTHIG
jgi:hypothetical protein